MGDLRMGIQIYEQGMKLTTIMRGLGERGLYPWGLLAPGSCLILN